MTDAQKCVWKWSKSKFAWFSDLNYLHPQCNLFHNKGAKDYKDYKGFKFCPYCGKEIEEVK